MRSVLRCYDYDYDYGLLRIDFATKSRPIKIIEIRKRDIDFVELKRNILNLAF